RSHLDAAAPPRADGLESTHWFPAALVLHEVMARRWPSVALTSLLLAPSASIPPTGTPPWRVRTVADPAQRPQPPPPPPAPRTPPAPEAPDVPGEEPAEVAPVAPEAAEADTLALQALPLGKPAPATPPPAFPPPSESAPASAAPEARAEVWDPESPLPE